MFSGSGVHQFRDRMPGGGRMLVPFFLWHRLGAQYRRRAAAAGLRNFDIFGFALNGVA
jgi:hypothetical protein